MSLPNPPPDVRSADGSHRPGGFLCRAGIAPVHVHADPRAVAEGERQQHPADGPDAVQAQRQIREAQAVGLAQAIPARRADHLGAGIAGDHRGQADLRRRLERPPRRARSQSLPAADDHPRRRRASRRRGSSTCRRSIRKTPRTSPIGARTGCNVPASKSTTRWSWAAVRASARIGCCRRSR